MATQGAGGVRSERAAQRTPGADITADSGGFGIQMTDDGEFTSGRRAERSRT